MKIQMKCFVVSALFLMVSAAQASAPGISFGLDCMIHDTQGKMLSDLGMIGSMMGSYTATETFHYNDLKIVADLNGPFPEAPEVAAPQLKLSVFDSQGSVLASVVTTATPTTNAALFIPSRDLYLHCDKMDM
jgi:hypothetical protein